MDRSSEAWIAGFYHVSIKGQVGSLWEQMCDIGVAADVVIGTCFRKRTG